MKTQHFKIFSISFLLLTSTICQSQIFEKITKKVRGISNKTKKVSFEKTAAISTSIKDTLYGIDWLDEDMFSTEIAEEINGSTLTPGYYKSTVRSYCLKAGVYGPTKGDGYQIARLKGRKAKLIHSILKKTIQYPNISQSNVQTLIWGIEAGAKFSKYPLKFQAKVRPLLTNKDILFMNVNFDKLKNKALPEKVKSLMNTYASLRQKMQNTQLKYDEIEAIAVKKGIPPIGIGSKEINKGIWSYIGNGFFLRAFPQVYTTTEIELYRPAKLSVSKDEKGRIHIITDASNTMKIIYNDEPGADILDYGHTKVPVWKIKKLHLSNSEKHRDTILNINAWVFRSSPDNLDDIMTKHEPSSPMNIFSKKKKGGPLPNEELHYLQKIDNDKKPLLDTVKDRLKKMKKWFKKFKELEGYAKEIDGMNEVKPNEHYLNDKYPNKAIYDGLKAVTNPADFKGKSTWIRKNLKMTMDLVMNAICALEDCTNNNPMDPDLASNPAQPGNTSKQRIGLSNYKK
ncbi:hypothetical protein ABW636_05765 [Aquimarina sp. 2201CG1-2-11]|uniref:hypothetical protein n=1 Tax=Aquimarina discodermiae TaxID=3231043 RepID=UPI0034635B5D